jgi:nucleotide-binding universal stress UspA family protein
MKNILVPTDYSANARNAAEYAIHLAKATGASVEFLHVFPQPEFIDDLPVNENSLRELIKKEKALLNKEARIFNSNFGIKIKCQVYPGKLHEVLKKMMFNQSADLVVAGIKGTSVIDRYFWGNTTTQLIKHATYPLLIIPSEKLFQPVNHITLAADYRSLLGEKSLHILKELSKAFKGKIQAVHIDDHEDDLAEIVDKTESERYFHRAFQGINHSYTTIEAENITTGLINFINSNNSDMVVMIPHKQNSWQSLFVGSTTKKMVYQSDIPLLILPA